MNDGQPLKLGFPVLSHKSDATGLVASRIACTEFLPLVEEWAIKLGCDIVIDWANNSSRYTLQKCSYSCVPKPVCKEGQ